MATQSNTVAHIGPAWNRYTVATFQGTFDTHIDSGEDYDTLTLAEIFACQPTGSGKMDSAAFIPSSYASYDAREHARQRDLGSFVALCGDVDEGDHAPDRMESLVRAFCGDCAWLIFSTANARPGNMRWRIVIPLAAPVPFAEWYDAQLAFFDFMQSNGVIMDTALARAAQPVYLPNVPEIHAKTGTPLRDEDGKPLYFKRKALPLSTPGLPLNSGVVSAHLAIIHRQREADETKREHMRLEALERRANRPVMEGGAIIEEFNRATSIETLLGVYGYEQSPRDSRDWRSPYQTGETYATRIMDGDKWVSLSGSDVGNRVGAQFLGGCFGDAYDLYVHFEHSGDHKAAFRALHAERRAEAVSHVTPPPPVQADDPGPQPEDFADMVDGEPVFDEPDEVAADSVGFDVVDAFDFDEAQIPPRPWVVPGVILSGYTHILAAPGGSGKSLFTLQMAIMLARGEPWGTFTPRRKAKTLIINVEDDLDEQRRRLAAALRVMDADKRELASMVHLVRDTENIVVAGFDENRRAMVATPIVAALVEYIRHHGIDVLIVDPFAETFEGDENDNSEVKWAMKIWRDQIARATGCAVYLVHHTTKGAAGKAGDADVVRGGGSIVNNTRISSTLMPMTREEAEEVGLNASDRHLYVRFDDAKANQSLKSGQARWFEKITVELANGTEDDPADEVGALRPWRLPTPFDGITLAHLKRVQQAVGEGNWRENQQASDWVGNAVADVLMLDAGEPKDRKRIGALVREWVRNDVLRVVEKEDAKRNPRKFVEVGKWVTE